MDKKYICYCGLYCENCAVMSKIAPAAKTLYAEMKTAGFDHIINLIPGGDGFWPFLKDMAEKGLCVSCQEGSGNPGCKVRPCAREKGVELCALCESYPCELYEPFLKNYPTLKADNDAAREQGMEAWAHLQDERKARGFSYMGK